jgi:hypothetical protein
LKFLSTELKVIAMMFPLFPLALLIIALGSIFAYQKSSNELTRMLAAGAAVVCLIWGFAIAHWSIHLLCLVLLLNLKVSQNLLQTVRIDK